MSLDIEAIGRRVAHIDQDSWLCGVGMVRLDYYYASCPLRKASDPSSASMVYSDAEFINHAPGDILALLAEVRRLRRGNH